MTATDCAHRRGLPATAKTDEERRRAAPAAYPVHDGVRMLTDAERAALTARWGTPAGRRRRGAA